MGCFESPTRAGLTVNSSACFSMKPWPGLPFAISAGASQSALGLSRSSLTGDLSDEEYDINTCRHLVAQQPLVNPVVKGRVRIYARNEWSDNDED
jgi:hypothetical protein